MRTASAASIAALVCVLVGLGCSSAKLVSDLSELRETAAHRISDHKMISSRQISAQLLQVTIRSAKLTKRFNLEVYHDGDITAFYTAGFAGRGSFKGLLHGSVLKLALPREKQYFDGPLSKLIDPDMGKQEYVAIRLRELLSGNLLCDPSDGVHGDHCDLWHQEPYTKEDVISRVVLRSRVDPIVIDADLFRFNDDFPYYRIKTVRITNSETGSGVRLKLIEQRYGPVPAVKLTLPDFTDWERVDHFELK